MRDFMSYHWNWKLDLIYNQKEEKVQSVNPIQKKLLLEPNEWQTKISKNEKTPLSSFLLKI